MADRVGKQPQQGQPDHFDKLMDSPCTNHAWLVKHLYKDCELKQCCPPTLTTAAQG